MIKNRKSEFPWLSGKYVAIRPRDKRVFEVVKRHNGKYEITTHTPYMITDAYLMLGDIWFDIDPFESFIQAVKFLKENINNLL